MTVAIDPYVGFVVLLALAFPVFVPTLFASVWQAASGESLAIYGNTSRWLLAQGTGFLVVVALVYAAAPSLFAFATAPAPLYAVALAAAVLATALEFGTAYAVVLARRRTLVRPRLTVPHLWRSVGPREYGIAVLAVVTEELIFRELWFGLLTDVFPLPVAAVVVLSAAAYGLNHVYFGGVETLQKTASGLVYGGLFVASGYAVTVPIVCHYAQNVFVGLAGRYTAD